MVRIPGGGPSGDRSPGCCRHDVEAAGYPKIVDLSS